MEEIIVDGTKKCKQCGRVLHKSNFRKYASRKSESSTRRTRVAENTVCLDCESFNLAATRLFKQKEKTPAQEEKLAKIADAYKALYNRGLQPIGAYAKHVLGLSVGRSNVANSTNNVDSYLAFVDGMVSAAPVDEEIVRELKGWITKELTEEPDYYNNHVYGELRVRCRVDELTRREAEEAERTGRPFEIKACYKELLDAVLERFCAYEDNYDWDGE